MSAPSRVLLLTRDGCHLCVEAESLIRDTCEELGVPWSCVDVDTHEELATRFTDHVPVTFVDQQLHGYWFVDQDKLRQSLLARGAVDTSFDWIVGQF